MSDTSTIPFERYDDEFITLLLQIENGLQDNVPSSVTTTNLIHQADDLLQQMDLVAQTLLDRLRNRKTQLQSLQTQHGRNQLLLTASGNVKDLNNNDHEEEEEEEEAKDNNIIYNVKDNKNEESQNSNDKNNCNEDVEDIDDEQESDDELNGDEEIYVPDEDEVWHYNCLSRAIDQRENEHHILKLIELYPMAVEQRNHEYNAYPLHKACYYRNYDTLVMKLIELFPMAAQHQDKDGYYPLNIACRKNQPDHVVMKLIETFPTAVNHETRVGKSLHMALRFDQSELVIRNLIDAYPMALKERDSWYNPDNDSMDRDYPIHLAINSHPMALVKYIIDLEPSSTKRRSVGSTPLHRFCVDNKFDLVEHVLPFTNKSLINAKDWNDNTPLDLACMLRSEKCVDLLLSHPDIDVNGVEYSTPLHAAIVDHMDESHFRIVQKLLDHPCILPDTMDYEDKTPLDTIKIMIKHIEDGTEDRNKFKEKLPIYLKTLGLFEDFPTKRRFQSYCYFTNPNICIYSKDIND